MSWTYILECSDGTLYCGAAKDVLARKKVHDEGKGARYTRGRRPLKLVFAEKTAGWRAALRREAQIKRMSRAKKLELIRSRRLRPEFMEEQDGEGEGGGRPAPRRRRGDA
jgi:putative endonuclease